MRRAVMTTWFLIVMMVLSACQNPAQALEAMREPISYQPGWETMAAASLAAVSQEAYREAEEAEELPYAPDDGPHVLSVQSPLYQQVLSEAREGQLPEGFFYAEELIPGVLLEPRYASEHNFMAQVLPGYEAPRVVVSRALGDALAAVQETLAPMGLGLKLYDAYRPLRAEEAMRDWALGEAELGDPTYYPRLEKWQILDQGYVAVGTGHTRGAAVDLTLIDLECGCELDMGGGFDLFDARSHTDNAEIDALARENRQLLKRVMEEHGFRNFASEWWHYQLIAEPHPGLSFNFVLE